MMKRFKILVSQNKVLWVVIGIIFIALIGIIWNWSLQACSLGHPNIKALYFLETDDFYE